VVDKVVVSDRPFSAENIVFEAFVVMGELKQCLFAMLAWRKNKVETHPIYILPSFSTHSQETTRKRNTRSYIFPSLTQRLYKSQFLQKLSCQKPYCE
jgi:hypothetical protein